MVVAQRITLDQLDPTLVRRLSPNGRNQSHWPRTKARERVMAMVYGAARSQGLRRPEGPVTVTFWWVMPTRRRFDVDNLASNGIVKASLDALVRGGWLPDDSSEHVRAVNTEWTYERGRRALVIEIKEVTG